MTKLRQCRSWTKAKRIAVVAAYEDSPTDARVNEFCQRLSAHLGPDCEIAKQMWLFTELRMAQLRTIAAGDAAKADLIIVSVHHAESLPDEIKTWVETWLGQKGARPIFLLALFDPLHQGDSSSMKSYLETMARRGKIEFLAQSEEVPENR